jgi:phage shock protein C
MTQMPSYRQLNRSQTDRMIGGVCGGVAEYFNVDPTLVRIAVVVATVFTGGALLLAYLVAMVVMPHATPAPVWNYPPTGYAPPTGTPPQDTNQ